MNFIVQEKSRLIGVGTRNAVGLDLEAATLFRDLRRHRGRSQPVLRILRTHLDRMATVGIPFEQSFSRVVPDFGVEQRVVFPLCGIQTKVVLVVDHRSIDKNLVAKKVVPAQSACAVAKANAIVERVRTRVLRLVVALEKAPVRSSFLRDLHGAGISIQDPLADR